MVAKLRQLEILRSVIRCQTTAAAARELGISQPAVSNAIQHMESAFGFPLFERLNNRLYPLEAARIINEDAAPIFAIRQSLNERIQELRDDKHRRLRIASTAPLGLNVIPQAITEFVRRHPSTSFIYDIYNLDEIVESIEHGHADIGFGLELHAQPALQVEALYRTKMVCICPPSWPLARRKTIGIDDLNDLPLIALKDTSRMGASVREAFKSAAKPVSFVVEVSNVNTACALVSAGIGASIVDPLSPMLWGDSRLAIRPFRPAIPNTSYVFWSRSRPLSRVLEQFIHVARRTMQQQLTDTGR